MGFVLICVVSLVALGALAAIASMLTKGGTDEPVVQGEDCATCTSKADGSCKIACLMENAKARRAASETEKKMGEEAIIP